MSSVKRTYHTLKVGNESFVVDVRYVNLKKIGHGSYGYVVSGTDEITGRKVAIKKIKNTFEDLIDAKRILREIKLLRHFNSHENVITVQDMMLYPADTVNFRDVYIVTNLMESDLDKIIGSNQSLTDQHYKYFLYQILRGLKYVHSANVIHRDLKPSNLLVNANCDLALCDFGLSRGLAAHDEPDLTLTEYVVTRWYRAPELLCDVSNYGKGVDIWSIGCIFAEMICRRPFFQGQNPHNQLAVIVDCLGAPPVDSLDFVTHPAAKKAIQGALDSGKQRDFKDLFPDGTNPVALDLMSKMLKVSELELGKSTNTKKIHFFYTKIKSSSFQRKGVPWRMR